MCAVEVLIRKIREMVSEQKQAGTRKAVRIAAPLYSMPQRSRGKLPRDYMLDVMLAARADKERRDDMHT